MIRFDREPYDVQSAFRRMAESGPQMLLALTSPFFAAHADSMGGLAIQHRLPTMFIFRRYAELGGLMSYGADIVAMYQQAAGCVAKILRGAKTADLPVEQPNKFELVVNLKTAKAIGVANCRRQSCLRRRGDPIARSIAAVQMAANGTSRILGAGLKWSLFGAKRT